MFAQTFCHIKKQDFGNPASVNYFDAQSNTSIGAQYNAMNGGRQEAKRKEMLAQTGGRDCGGFGRKRMGPVSASFRTGGVLRFCGGKPVKSV